MQRLAGPRVLDSSDTDVAVIMYQTLVVTSLMKDMSSLHLVAVLQEGTSGEVPSRAQPRE